jgi:acetolactate synthase-1/2/3 large subunit
VDGDLRVALRRLAAPQHGFSTEEIAHARGRILVHFRRPSGVRLAAQDIIEIARRVLPEDGILFSETGIPVCMLEHLWPVSRPGTYFGTSGGRTMGLTLPAILGARLARPDVPMIGLGSDGSTLMRLGELEVFARTGAAVPLVICNDRALGTIKSRQRSRGLDEYKLDLYPVDLAEVARACGLLGATVRTPEELEKALTAAMVADRTTLIDAQVEPRAYQDSFGPTIGMLG